MRAMSECRPDRNFHPIGGPSSGMIQGMTSAPSLVRFAWLSIVAAVLTISLKAGAYFLTGSVGLLSDALESLVNLVAAIGALIALSVAERAPDEEHAYGYEKAEYFSSGLEGALILVAAVSIILTAVPRLLAPREIEAVGLGLGVSSVATILNLLVAWRLFRAAREHHSITLEADARHLLTDVWTSAGVIVGVISVNFTGWLILDPIIALAVAGNIVLTGIGLVRRSADGLLDVSCPPAERAKIQAVLDDYSKRLGLRWHALRTRQAGRRRFIAVHILVPGEWTVHRGHQLLEEIEADLRATGPRVTVFTHLESLDDPASWDDMYLDRVSPPPSEVARSAPRR
jgi:cation diffusion facilitator family transporter